MVSSLSKRSKKTTAKKQSARKSATVKTRPTKLTIRTYQVGFGDSFLLTFTYPKGKRRHVLIDFGTTALPDNHKDAMERIAENICEECKDGTEPLAIVVTHRHQDHVSGFATDRGPGALIAELKPKLVVQPWTEAPDAEPTPALLNKTKSHHFVGALRDMHAVAESALFEARENTTLEFLGEDNIKNHSAALNLMTMPGRKEYLHYGSRTALERHLPGVKVKVLGPPTLEQSTTISKMRAKDEAEYWHLQAGASLRARTSEPLFPDLAHYDEVPPYARWLKRRAQNIRRQQLLGVVRALDTVMNNTSLILLFTVGKQKLLFPGDAQIENWLYALSEADDWEENRKLLAGVNVYKVGHHGSLNATPKTLWSLLENAKPEAKNRLKTLLSTKSNKHGNARSKTEVPRTTLVEELKKRTTLIDTRKITKKNDLYTDLEIDL